MTDVSKLNSQNITSFMDFISGDVAEELKAVLSDQKTMADNGFVAYGLYDTDLNVTEGALVAQVTGAVATIRSLYIDPFYRGFGGGAMLVEELIHDAFLSEEIAEIELMVASDSDIQTDTANFLYHCGFEREDAVEAWFSSTLDEIKSTGTLSKIPSDKAVVLRNVDNKSLDKLNNVLSGGDVAFVPLPIRKEDYEQDISSCILNSAGEITDIVLLEKSEEGIIVSYAYSAGASIGIGMSLAASVKRAIDKYPGETRVLIPTVTESSEKLVEKIAPGAKKTGFVRCVYPMLPMYERIYGRDKEFRL